MSGQADLNEWIVPERRYPKEVILKDGTEIVLRPLGADDVDALCQFYAEVQPHLRWFMKEDPCEAGIIAKWIANQKAGRAFSILALVDTRVVAHASLLMRLRGGRQHVARLRVYVSRDFRRKQLGTWMLFDLVRYAMNRGLEVIRTDFVVGVDDLAIRAVRKMDFVTEAIIKDYVKDDQGHYHDYQIMIKQLHKEWSDF